jgi:hypothetical protein
MHCPTRHTRADTAGARAHSTASTITHKGGPQRIFKSVAAAVSDDDVPADSDAAIPAAAATATAAAAAQTPYTLGS